MRMERRSQRFLGGVASLLRLAVCLAIVTVASAQTRDSKQPLASKSLGQISGHVYRGSTSEPVSKAQVQLSGTTEETVNAAGGERIVRTAVDGAFVFPDLPAGTYQIEVSHNGYAQFTWVQSERNRRDPSSETTSITLQPGQIIDDVVLRLHPAGIIAGQISDEDHDPVPKLQVWALAVDFVRGGRRRISAAGKAITDDLGNFRIANLPPGPYYVRAGGLINNEMEAVALKQGPAGGVQYRETYYPGTASLDEAQLLQVSGDGTNNAQFTVPTEKTYTVTGKVVQRSGSLPGQVPQVEWSRQDAQGFVFQVDNQATTDVGPDGSFKIPHMPPGDYTLSSLVLHPGGEGEPGYASVRVVDSDVRANVEIGNAIEVRGRLEVPQGFPLAGTQITLQTYGPGFYLLHQGPVDPSGRFYIKKVPPGEYTFIVQIAQGRTSAYVRKAICNGKDYASSGVVLTLDTTLDCDVTVANDTSVVHGKIADGEAPASKAVAVLIPESKDLRPNPRYTLTSKTDDSGAYSISGVIPGDYLLFAVPPSKDHAFFALDFAEQHGGGEQVSLKPGATQAVDLKLSKSE